MLSTAPLAYGADDVALQTIKVRADRPSAIDSVVVVDNERVGNSTLGGMLEHVAGVQDKSGNLVTDL